MAALGLALLFTLWLVFPRSGANGNKKNPKIERWELRMAQMAHDSLYDMGNKALQKDQIAQAKDYFQEALQAAAGFAIDTDPTQTALAKCNDHLKRQATPTAPAIDQQPVDQAQKDKPAKGEPILTKEELAWQKAETADKEDLYRKYLEAFPEGKFARKAREKIAELYSYRPTFPFSMSGDKILKLTLRDGTPPYRVRVNDPSTEKSIEKTFDKRGNYEIPLSTFQQEGLGSRMISINVMDGNFKTFRSGLPF
jgi:hypothetical protein